MPDKNDIEKAEDLLPSDAKLKQMLWGAAEEIAKAAAQWAPMGWTGDLKKSITANEPVKIGDGFVATITTYANDVNGQDYAFKMHDEEHYHSIGYPTKSFGESASDKSISEEDQYWLGYAEERKAGTARKFKTEFFFKAIDQEGERVMKILNEVFS